MDKQVGKNRAMFYEARNGLYHILKYLNKEFKCKRVFLPKKICYVVTLASKTAGYEILYYTRQPAKMRNNDVIVMTDPAIKAPDSVFSISDNAKNAMKPEKRHDFTLYSFGSDKPLSSPRGGMVVVNKSRCIGFLNIKSKLNNPDFSTEFNAYLNYIFYKFWTYETFVNFARKMRHATVGDNIPSGKIVHLDFSMCSISRKLAQKLVIK
ncbi:MAG: hypothetical protein ABR981_01135 [Candidatus Micrarchaeaceae archaeon]|jgi:hypothetical protein